MIRQKRDDRPEPSEVVGFQIRFTDFEVRAGYRGELVDDTDPLSDAHQLLAHDRP